MSIQPVDQCWMEIVAQNIQKKDPFWDQNNFKQPLFILSQLKTEIALYTKTKGILLAGIKLVG